MEHFSEDLNTILTWMDDLEKVPELQHTFEYFMIKVWTFSKLVRDYAREFHKFYHELQTRIERGKSIELRCNHFQHKNVSFNEKFQEIMEQNTKMVELLDAKLLEDDIPEDLRIIILQMIDFLTKDLFNIKFANVTDVLLEDMEKIKTDVEFRNLFCFKHADSYDIVFKYSDYLREITPPMCPTCGYKYAENDQQFYL